MKEFDPLSPADPSLVDAELYPEGGGINYENADVYQQADFIHRYCTRRDYTDLPMVDYLPEIVKMEEAMLKFEINNSRTYHLLREVMGLPECRKEEFTESLAQQMVSPEK